MAIFKHIFLLLLLAVVMCGCTANQASVKARGEMAVGFGVGKR